MLPKALRGSNIKEAHLDDKLYLELRKGQMSRPSVIQQCPSAHRPQRQVSRMVRGHQLGNRSQMRGWGSAILDQIQICGQKTQESTILSWQKSLQASLGRSEVWGPRSEPSACCAARAGRREVGGKCLPRGFIMGKEVCVKHEVIRKCITA